MQDEEFIQSFVEESKVHVETVETELLNLDLEAIDMDSVNNIFRAVHSIKGSSGFFDFMQIVSLSHAMENVFGDVRAGQMLLTADRVDILLAANDCLRTMIDDVMNSENIEIAAFTEKLSHFFLADEPPDAVATEDETPVALTDAVDDTVFRLDDPGVSTSLCNHVKEELRRGCRLFRLKKKLYGDLIGQNVNVVELLADIAAMGSLADCRIEIGNRDVNDEPFEEDAILHVLFCTVLERDFLPPSISEPEAALTELSVAMDADASRNEVVGDDEEGVWEEDPGGETQQAETLPSIESQTKASVPDMAPALSESKKSGGAAILHDGERQKGHSLVSEDTIRVNVSLLNNLLNMSSEMVLARNQLFRTMEIHKKEIPDIEPIFQNINHITTNLQEKMMQTRMQPISNVFSKFPRIVRDIAKKLDKDILLELEGTEVELDKSIIESLGDPLTHLVRNAVDHGLEQPEDRIRSGKPRTGTIKLKAYHESGYVNIDVVDDGKGINTGIIRQKAFDKGFIQKSDLSAMGDQESLQLLFRPGFSTADAVTDISGRGVGMDVVKTNIEKLGGKIEIFTELGSGTTFRLLLPLTLAIIPSLIVEVEQQKFALPQINVQEIVRIKAGDASRKIEFINNAEVLRLRGKLLPIIRLADVLGLQRTYLDPETGERHVDKRTRLTDARRDSNPLPPDKRETRAVGDHRGYGLTNIVRILVIKIGSRRLGLSVDSIFGSEEILVKTLPVHVKECKNYSGVTILGDGKAAMILDPGGIIENANLRYVDALADGKIRQSQTDSEKMREYQSLLLFQGSGPETLALDMSLVSRVDEIKPGEIETIGDKEYIKFRGETLRVIRPEDYLPIRKRDARTQPLRKQYVIIPKLMRHPMGILIENLQDTIQTRIQMAQQDGTLTKGLVGSAIIQDRIVLLLNVYELFELVNPEQYGTDSQIKSQEPLKVLLVEDTPFFQKLERDYLENAGYHIFLAENGLEALQMLQKEVVDAVVSDINMPEMNGLELVKRIRADSLLAGLPVIAVTSLTGEQQKKEGIAAGFDAYEFKLDRARLLEVLMQTISKKRAKV